MSPRFLASKVVKIMTGVGLEGAEGGGQEFDFEHTKCEKCVTF